jgi:HD-like signal output (HDOD) protein/ActR/RegA family two-component response regulator
MANILLLDDNEIACRAMQGILTRGQHRCIIANEAETAFKQLRELVKFDLVFLELKLSKGENGMHFLQRLREDTILKLIPIVVYSTVTHQEIVKKALSLKIQNYLIKPYRDESIYAEIGKAVANPWRNLHFEEEKSFCTQMGLKVSELKKMLHELRVALYATIEPLQDCAEVRNQKEAVSRIDPLAERAEAAGAWGIVEYLQGLKAKLEMRNWQALTQSKDDLNYICRFIDCHLDHNYTPAAFYSEQERKEQEEAKLRDQWVEADLSRGPLVQQSEIRQKLEILQAGPVIDTVSAAFLMNADGRAPSLNQLIDLVSKDPWLTAQVLITANQLEHDEMTSIEDLRLAVTMMGYEKLTAMAKTMPTVEERYLRLLPWTWAHYWMFQVAVARVAQFAAVNLELTDLAPNAYTAGLLHDYGRLLLAQLYPFSFQAIVSFAKKSSLLLSEAEQKYVGWTVQEIGESFARKHGMPEIYCEVIRWVGTPEAAGERPYMVALVTLARQLCLQNQIGFSGEVFRPPSQVEETPAWQILRARVFPSFNLRKFESQTHNLCSTLKLELAGQV